MLNILHIHIWAPQTLQSSLKNKTKKQTNKDNKDNIFIIRDIKLRQETMSLIYRN